MNKEYLMFIKPKTSLSYTLILFLISIIIILPLTIKTYDVYNTKGYITCEEKCHIYINTNLTDTNKFINISYLKLDNQIITPSNTSVSDIKIDEESKSNYQVIDYEVARLDGVLNIYQDVYIYTNYEKIIQKIIRFILE